MQNYEKILLNLVKTFDHKPTLLLHSCCGPCSTQVIDFLKDYFIITIYYYNPNIEPEMEYIKRKQEQIRFIKEYNLKTSEPIKYLECAYENAAFKTTALGLEKEKEGGARCSKCFYLRLAKTAQTAKNNNFEYFGTTLTVSPHKNSQIINMIGSKIASEIGISFIFGDFKKHDGYQKSLKFSREYNLYRQNYCGCLYGKEQSHD